MMLQHGKLLTQAQPPKLGVVYPQENNLYMEYIRIFPNTK